MKLIKGASLAHKQLAEVKSRYAYRFVAIGKDKYYATEQDWIINHAFYVNKDGTLSNKHKHCEPVSMASL